MLCFGAYYLVAWNLRSFQLHIGYNAYYIQPQKLTRKFKIILLHSRCTISFVQVIAIVMVEAFAGNLVAAAS